MPPRTVAPGQCDRRRSRQRRPHSNFDAVTARALKGRVQGLISEVRPEIVCDLTAVSFVDSAGLSALVASVRAAGERGGFFRLVGVNGRVAHMFRLTMLDRVFEVHSTIEAAVAPADAWPVPLAA